MQIYNALYRIVWYVESFQVFANQVTYAWVVILVTALLRVFSDYICN